MSRGPKRKNDLPTNRNPHPEPLIGGILQLCLRDRISSRQCSISDRLPARALLILREFQTFLPSSIYGRAMPLKAMKLFWRTSSRPPRLCRSWSKLPALKQTHRLFQNPSRNLGPNQRQRRPCPWRKNLSVSSPTKTSPRFGNSKK